jgi:transposase
MPFQDYSPEQGALLPVHVRDVLTEKHLVFLIHEVVERQDLGEWEAGYSEEGQRPYHPALLLKVLLYVLSHPLLQLARRPHPQRKSTRAAGE